MIKNYLLFYSALVIFIIGGIRLTSYVLEKKKKEKFEATNHHQMISGILMASGQVKPDDLKNRTIVLYHWNEYQDNSGDFAKLNALNAKYSYSSVIYAISTRDREHGEDYFRKKKIVIQLQSLHKQHALSQYNDYIATNFYDSDSLKNMQSKTPVTVVVNPKGEVRFFKIGSDNSLSTSIEKAISQ